MTKEDRAPRVIDGVHFVWVPEYKESNLVAHWLSISHHSVVRVFEPRDNDPAWRVYLYNPDSFPKDIITSRIHSTNFFTEYYSGTENTVWQKAVEWTKRPLPPRWHF